MNETQNRQQQFCSVQYYAINIHVYAYNIQKVYMVWPLVLGLSK